jgi:hypothetical protein
VTDDPASEVRASDVVRRDELTAAVQAAADAYRESHAFRGLFSAPSSLPSTYRASDHPVDLPFGFA